MLKMKGDGRIQPASFSSHITEIGDGQARGHRAGTSGFILLRCLRSRHCHLAATMHEQSPCCRMVCLAQVSHVVEVEAEKAFAVRKEQWSRYGMTDDPHWVGVSDWETSSLPRSRDPVCMGHVRQQSREGTRTQGTGTGCLTWEAQQWQLVAVGGTNKTTPKTRHAKRAVSHKLK